MMPAKKKTEEFVPHSKDISLRVTEALPKDVGRGIARVDPAEMDRLGIGVGGFIRIEGKKTTAAKVMPTFADLRGKGLIQIDGISRENAKGGIDEKVKVSAVEVDLAKSITLKALSPLGVVERSGETRYLGKLVEGLAVTRGDKVRVTLFGTRTRDFVATQTVPDGVVMVTAHTAIRVEVAKEAKEKAEVKRPFVSYEDVGGLEKEIQRVREMIELPLKNPQVFERLGIEPPKGVLLYGPPGTGKTLIARAVAHEADANFYTVNGPEIVHKFYGESEAHLRSLFEEASRDAPSILFIDEIDAIAPKRANIQGEVEKRIVATLLSMMDGLKGRGNLIVIGATNIPDVIDPALRRPGRFDREIQIGIPDRNGRLKILEIHTRGMPLAADVSLEKLADITHGYVGADLEALGREAAMTCLRESMEQGDITLEEIPYEVIAGLEVTQSHFIKALNEIEPSAIREVSMETPNVHWSDIGGLEDVKKVLIETVEWPLRYGKLFQKANLKPTKGILLAGPPGTGKTLLAKALAAESEVNFISIKGPELISKWVGESLPGFEPVAYLNDECYHNKKIGDLVGAAPRNKVVRTIAFDKNGMTSFQKVSDYIQHKNSSRSIYKVTTKRGMSVCITKDHSLFTIGNGGIESIPTSKIVPNEAYIALPRKVERPPTCKILNELDLFQMFENSLEIRVYGATEFIRSVAKDIGYKPLSQILGINRKQLDDLLYHKTALPLKQFLEISKLAKRDYSSFAFRLGINGSTIPSKIPLTKEFMELLGLWVAEGDINQGSLRLTTASGECLEVCRTVASSLGIQCGEYSKGGNKAITVLLISKPLAMVVESLGFKKGCFEKNVPPFIHNVSLENIGSFLRGYLSGDGCVNVRRPDRSGADNISLCTVSKNLAHDISMLYRYFGLVPTIVQKKNRLGNIEYIVNIGGVDHYRTFSNTIGFLQPWKNERIGAFIKRKKWRRDNNLPLIGVVYEFTKKYFPERLKGKSIDRLSLIKRLAKGDCNQELTRRLRPIISEGMYWDKVMSIEKSVYDGPVYDLSVDPNQNFVSGFGGVFVHNSEKGIREVFKKAKSAAPCILFFDEIDSICPKRGSGEGDSGVMSRTISQFLTELDGLEELRGVVILGASNRLDLIDPAIIRPGRFDHIIGLGLPDLKAREAIFKIHTKGCPLEKGILFSEWAREAEGRSGAEIESICRQAITLAIREFIGEHKEKTNEKAEKLFVRKEHFEEVVKKMLKKGAQK